MDTGHSPGEQTRTEQSSRAHGFNMKSNQDRRGGGTTWSLLLKSSHSLLMEQIGE